MNRHRIGRLVLFLTVIATGVSVATPGAATAATGLTKECETAASSERGVFVERFDATDVTEGIAALPPRTTISVEPGQETIACVGFHNRTGEAIDLRLKTRDVTVADDGGPASTELTSEFGASRWLRLPASTLRDVKHGELAWVAVEVNVPLGQGGGSTYSSVVATVDAGDPESAEGAVVQSAPEVTSQVFFEVPGGKRAPGRVVKERAPRVLWWDGLDLGDLPVLERLRGLGVATVRFEWQNRSDFSEEVRSRVVIESDLTGRDVARLDVDPAIVLRSSERPFRATWSRGIPLVGRFTPIIEVTTTDGETRRVRLDPIWVIPSWWYLLALALATALPLWWRRRSRRQMDELLARVEAAEARAAGNEEGWGEDADWEHRE